MLSFLFCLGNKVAYYVFFLFGRRRQLLRDTCITQKTLKCYLLTLTARHRAIVTPYVHTHALSYDIKFGGNKVVCFCPSCQVPKLVSRQYYLPLNNSSYNLSLQFQRLVIIWVAWAWSDLSKCSLVKLNTHVVPVRHLSLISTMWNPFLLPFTFTCKYTFAKSKPIHHGQKSVLLVNQVKFQKLLFLSILKLLWKTSLMESIQFLKIRDAQDQKYHRWLWLPQHACHVC